MEHVGTICTHCSNGCKTTLGVRNDEIIRGNNRDRSGINGEFLCIKGRYAFDFTNIPERLQSPLMRKNGKLEPVSWSQALATVATKFNEVKARGGKFGVIGSNHTTNEENFYLQKFARAGSGHQQYRSSPHRRSGHAARCAERQERTLWPRPPICTTRKAVLVVGSRSCAAASVPGFPDSRQFPASRGARLRRHAGPGARRQLRDDRSARRAGRGARSARIAARQACRPSPNS